MGLDKIAENLSETIHSLPRFENLIIDTVPKVIAHRNGYRMLQKRLLITILKTNMV